MKRCQVERMQVEGFQIAEERMNGLTRFCRFSVSGAVGLQGYLGVAYGTCISSFNGT